MFSSAMTPARRGLAGVVSTLVVGVAALALGATSASAQSGARSGAQAPTGTVSAIAHGDHDYVVKPGGRALRAAEATRLPAGVGARLAKPAVSASAVYDVHVLAVDTAAGPHGTNPTESRQMISKLGEDFSAQTGGAITFRYADFTVLPATTAIGCNVADLEERYSRQISRLGVSAGATDATWVIVTAEDERCGYAAEGYLASAGVHMNGHWGAWGAGSSITSVHVMPLAHEVSHNLGLRHAARSTSTTPWALPFSYSEYGDDSSLMGSSTGVKLTAADRSALGILPAAQIAVSTGAAATESFTLGAFGDAASSDLLVVPVAGARAYQIERVAGYGSASLQIRVTDGLLAQLGSAETGTESVLVSQPGWKNGTVALPGGVTLSVGTVTGSTTQVTLTRSVDTAAPRSTGTDLCRVGTVANGVCRVRTGNANYTVKLTPTTSGDDTFVASTTLLVDGQSIGSSLRNEVRSGSQARIRFQAAARTSTLSLAPGRHTVEVRRTDLAGNTSVQRSAVVVAAAGPRVPSKVMWLDAVAAKGAVRVSWIGDLFPSVTSGRSGNAYRVSITRIGGSTRTVSVAPSKESVKLTGLRRGTYKVSVCAKNVSGCSAARTVRVKVKR